jgi:coproporphyrinogen III oxidase-like Fe-S oxidoreductase
MLAVIKTSLYYYLREFKDVGVNRVSVGVQVCEA